MKKVSFLFLFMPLLCASQGISLLPSIGLFSPPADTDSICYIHNVNPSNGGIPHIVPDVGDTMADFTLFDLNGDSVNLHDQLLNVGKHILLVSGSFT